MGNNTNKMLSKPYGGELLTGLAGKHQNEQLHQLLSSGLVKIHKVDPATLSTEPKPDNAVRFVCISDTHGAHRQLTEQMPPGDILIHAGDFTNTGEESQIIDFNAWLGELPYRHKVVIAGNHDLTLDENMTQKQLRRFGMYGKYDPKAMLAKITNCHYLFNSSVTLEGITIAGSPYQPWFHDWAFNLHRGDPCRKMWETIPTTPKVDVLVTHGPLLGHGDLCDGSGEHAGCADLLDWVQTYKPRFMVCGHIHEGYGVTATTNRDTICVNASSLDVAYNTQRMNAPIVFDFMK
eukprot:PhF_6_TR44505/c0_g1_i1/m.68546